MNPSMKMNRIKHFAFNIDRRIFQWSAQFGQILQARNILCFACSKLCFLLQFSIYAAENACPTRGITALRSRAVLTDGYAD